MLIGLVAYGNIRRWRYVLTLLRNELHDFSTLESGQAIQLEKSVFSLRHLLEDLQELCLFSFGKEDIEFIVEIGSMQLVVEKDSAGEANKMTQTSKSAFSVVTKSARSTDGLGTEGHTNFYTASEKSPRTRSTDNLSEDESAFRPDISSSSIDEDPAREEALENSQMGSEHSTLSDDGSVESEEDLIVISDEGRLRRILICLLSNVSTNLVTVHAGIYLIVSRPSSLLIKAL